MCGIFGFTKTDDITRRMTGPLAIYMNERGNHSWGVTDGDYTHKEKGSIVTRFQELDLEGPIYHTRMASVGGVSDRNAHPFEFAKADGGKIIGIHNGHISNWSELKSKYKRKDLEVDSEHIFMHLAEGLSLKDIHGWGAVVWYDIAPDGSKRKFASRFGGQDNLHIAKLKNDCLVFASTDSSIETACRFADVGIDFFYDVKPMVKYELGQKNGHAELLVIGPMDWDSEPVVSHGYSGGGKRDYTVTSVCAIPVCNSRVDKDRLICRDCAKKKMHEYFGDKMGVKA